MENWMDLRQSSRFGGFLSPSPKARLESLLQLLLRFSPQMYPPLVQITLAHVGGRPASADEFERMTQLYLQRTAPFARCESAGFRSEQSLLEWLTRQQGRTPVIAVLLDSRGRQMTSEAFAAWLGERRDEGSQHVVFAIGPPSGWSETARARARLLLSLGQFTMVHPLARLVMAEQIYRASTILTGHPYHTGH